LTAEEKSPTPSKHDGLTVSEPGVGTEHTFEQEKGVPVTSEVPSATAAPVSDTRNVRDTSTKRPSRSSPRRKAVRRQAHLPKKGKKGRASSASKKGEKGQARSPSKVGKKGKARSPRRRGGKREARSPGKAGAKRKALSIGSSVSGTHVDSPTPSHSTTLTTGSLSPESLPSTSGSNVGLSLNVTESPDETVNVFTAEYEQAKETVKSAKEMISPHKIRSIVPGRTPQPHESSVSGTFVKGPHSSLGSDVSNEFVKTDFDQSVPSSAKVEEIDKNIETDKASVGSAKHPMNNGINGTSVRGSHSPLGSDVSSEFVRSDFDQSGPSSAKVEGKDKNIETDKASVGSAQHR
jgi:hypothetical protein